MVGAYEMVKTIFQLISFGSIWAIDIVQDLPFPVNVDAIDISMAQCPPKTWLPENIKILAHDVYQPFPAAMLGTYDLVNVQNWLCIWKEETSQTLVRNLLGLLSECWELPSLASSEFK